MDFGDKVGDLTEDLPNVKDLDITGDANSKQRKIPAQPSIPPDLSENMGECIILNYQVYEKYMKLETRSGSKYDADRLEYVFNELKFNVQKYLDRSKLETLDILEKASLKVSEGKYFVCCILTHGDKYDRVATKDGWLELDDFLDYFYSSTCLANKKIFIIQACRGGDVEKSVKMESTDCIPTGEKELYPDFIIANSTYPGKLSFKTSQGSYYIQSFCNCIENLSSNQDLLQILTVVNYHMANFFQSRADDAYLNKARQMPCFSSTLKSPILFGKSIKPFQSSVTDQYNERRARMRLDQSGELNPSLDLKAYCIPTANNVQFFQLIVTKGGLKVKSALGKKDLQKELTEKLKEAASDLSVYMSEKQYQRERAVHDLKKSEIMAKLTSYAKWNYTDIKCMICFIASYSKGGYLCDKDGRKFSKQDVVEKFVAEHVLVGKPKIFIFLMCEVSMESSDGVDVDDRPDSYFTAEHADILEVTISVKKKEHLLGPMKEFGQQLKKCSRSEDLLTTLTKINSILIEKYNFQNTEPRSTFMMNSTLTKKIFLP